MHTIQLGNIILIIVGVLLVLSGPYIMYKTVTGVIRRRRADPSSELQPFGNGVNLLIGLLFFLAGIFFILNNLRGNPLA